LVHPPRVNRSCRRRCCPSFHPPVPVPPRVASRNSPEGFLVTMKIASCAALVLAASCFSGSSDAYTVSRSTLRNLAAPKSIGATPSGSASRTSMKMEGACVFACLHVLLVRCTTDPDRLDEGWGRQITSAVFLAKGGNSDTVNLLDCSCAVGQHSLGACLSYFSLNVPHHFVSSVN
jgi:hypothetical protein